MRPDRPKGVTPPRRTDARHRLRRRRRVGGRRPGTRSRRRVRGDARRESALPRRSRLL